MKKRLGLLSVLLLASPHAIGERQKGDIEALVPAGEWVSTKPQNVHFILDHSDYFSGVVLFNCAAAEQKIRLTAIPSGAGRVREISRDERVRWDIELIAENDTFTGELVGGSGRLPSVLFSPAAPWLDALGNDHGEFILIIDGAESYRLPTSNLISSTIRTCNPPVS